MHDRLTLALAAALGGALGSAARFLATEASAALAPGQRWWGTLAVNVVGSVLMGVLLTRWAGSRPADDPLRALAIAGILGGLTTFSALAAEIHGLVSSGRLLSAGGLALAHLALGVGGVALGCALAR